MSETEDRRAASDPSTGLERLDDLAGPWPREVATNPVWRDTSLDEAGLRTVWAICASPDAVRDLEPSRLYARLNGHADEDAQRVVLTYLTNAALPRRTRWQALQRLTIDDLRALRVRFMLEPGPDPVAPLIVRAELARQGGGPSLDPAELGALAQHQSLLWLYLRQPNCPPAALVEHLADDIVALSHPAFPLDVLVSLASAEDPVIRACVAGHPALPQAQQRVLADDPDAFVRQAVARRDASLAGSAQPAEPLPAPTYTVEELARPLEAMDPEQVADTLAEPAYLWLPPSIAVALAARRDPLLDAVLGERVDLCPEAWRVMLYGST